MTHPRVAPMVIQRAPVEQVPPGEQAAIESMIEQLKDQLTNRYPPTTTTRRDAHPKHHGLVTATFIVDRDCPAEMRHGLFREPGRFDAVIRYSNGFPEVGHDLAADIRGMAIHVSTERLSLLGDQAQDFLLATGEAFFGTNAVDYVEFPAAFEAGNIGLARYFVLGRRWRGLWQLVKGRTKPASPLVEEYFSQTPYQLGPHCVKYHVRPAPDVPERRPWYVNRGTRLLAALRLLFARTDEARRRVPGFNALRTALEADLAAGPVTLEFLVQRWPDLSTLPVQAIEDATRTWNARWVRVATIQVHQQRDIARRDDDAERMNFSPWRTLPEHQPLGGINRARRAVYQAMSDFRRDRNGG